MSEPVRVHPKPFEAFQININQISVLPDPEFKERTVDANSVGETFNTVLARLQELNTGLTTDENRAERQAKVDKLTADINAFIPQYHEARKWVAETKAALATVLFLNSWKLVMMVTFCEAYVEDALRLLIAANAITPIPPKEGLKDPTGAWVNNLLRDKPSAWIKQFESLGAVGYRDGLADKMGKLWKRRHLIIHAPTTKLEAQPREVERSLDIVNHFVLTTDEFVAKALAR